MPDIPTVIADRLAHIVSLYDGDDLSLHELLVASHEPGDVAFRFIGGEDITYARLNRLSAAIAGGLAARGIGHGDCVAVLMGKSPEMVATLVAAWRLGAVVMPIFTAFSTPAVTHRLQGGKAKAVIADVGQVEKLDPAIIAELGLSTTVFVNGRHGEFSSLASIIGERSPAPVAARLPAAAPMIRIFTSGTTGKPKGVDLPLRALASIRAYAEFGLFIEPGDTYWCAADPGWAYGLYYAIVAPLLIGQRSILLPGGFDPQRTLSILAEEGVTNFAAAPTIYRALRTCEPSGLLQVTKASSAGEPLGADLDAWALETFGTRIHDHYGQTEAGMMVNNHHHPLLRNEAKAGSMGRTMPGWHAVILDEQGEPAPSGETGKLAMSLDHSPLAWFAGYLDAPKATQEKFSPCGRYYLTGDAARMDADGLITFYARDDDIVLMAGYRIGPQEVESVLNDHPKVAASAAFGVPDEVMGERLEACVVLTDTSDAPSTVELQQWVKDRFARHAYPRSIHFIAEMPLTPSGKIKRFALRKRFGAT
ncbi:AMP-binding protein [Croceicoccus mobilis]|uniref:AMP-dependent synthetase n=1 Tax=Croceicoccus mobilis TaxID=1703339 RepID=A0A917DQP7_9SPHN|nr:AMP-binding protein [Croceicoccus mobilis]GGD57521.1 AMP-dependent synthetase [Croceicoccus mobilis]